MVKDQCKVCGREVDCVVFTLYNGEDNTFAITDRVSTDFYPTVEVCRECITENIND